MSKFCKYTCDAVTCMGIISQYMYYQSGLSILIHGVTCTSLDATGYDRRSSTVMFDPRAILSNSYTMGCPPVRGDNPRALARGLSYYYDDSFM